MNSPENLLLTQPLGRVLARTALPIVLIMAMNGLFQVVDAAFLGHFVGPDALAAVTLMFPLIMFLIALSTLVGSGMASVLSRKLGAGSLAEARDVFVGAHWLSLLVSVAVMLLFAVGGDAGIHALANGSPRLAEMGSSYLSITVLFVPITFLLSIHGDALRCEDRLVAMAALAIGSSLLNIAFNYLLIAQMGLGVEGSALGTGLAQAVAGAAVSAYRMSSGSELAWNKLWGRWRRAATTAWREVLALGVPQSLSFLGFSLSAGLIIFSIQHQGALTHEGYEATIGAYGIFTRVMTFCFLPLLGLKLAGQTIIGNNAGAQQMERVGATLKLVLATAFVYCALIQSGLWLFRDHLAGFFVHDLAISRELARIAPLITLSYFAAGPLLMVPAYFQAIGDTRRAALLGVSRIYFFVLPLLLILPSLVGEVGIWLAMPTADVLNSLLTFAVMQQRKRAKKELSRAT